MYGIRTLHYFMNVSTFDSSSYSQRLYSEFLIFKLECQLVMRTVKTKSIDTLKTHVELRNQHTLPPRTPNFISTREKVHTYRRIPN